MKATRLLLFLAMLRSGAAMADDGKLSGTVIGTELSVDYAHAEEPSTTVNTCAMAFDGNLETFFASWERAYTWVGLDLGAPHVVSRVGWSPRNAPGFGDVRVRLAVFEGANREDFMDAVPLYIIREAATIGEMTYADISCSKGFRYVRYVGPADGRCNIAELEFYGHPGEGDESLMPQLTNLPTVCVHTLNNELPYDKEHQIDAVLTVSSVEDGLLQGPGTIRERGNASRGFPKKPYRIKFEKKQRPLDAAAMAKKWTLINNYGDKTLMRNLIAFEFSRLLDMPYTPYARLVDVVVNGEYKGCYQLSDQVEVNKNRVDIDEMTPQDNAGAGLLGGYLIEVDAYAYSEPSWFNSVMGTPVTIKSPDEDFITSAQRTYIEKRFNQMESDWRNYLDTNTFLRHLLVQELAANIDAYWSAFMYKKRDDPRLFVGPVWDFDIAFDNDLRIYPTLQYSDDWLYTFCSYAGNFKSLVTNVMSDANVRQQMLDIWDEARQRGLSKEYMAEYIDSVAAELDASQQLNFTRWPTLDQTVHNNPVARGSYEAEVNYVKEFVQDRIDWIDQKLGYVFVPNTHHPTPITQHPSPNTQHPSPNTRVDFNMPYDVFSPDGRPCGHDLNNLPCGIYIVKQGEALRKVTIH